MLVGLADVMFMIFVKQLKKRHVFRFGVDLPACRRVKKRWYIQSTYNNDTHVIPLALP
jgi:hypothetical protein